MITTRDFSEVNPMLARPGEPVSAPKSRLGDSELLPETAYQLVHDEAMLDGNARLNLATFVGTWMDPFANQLYAEAFDKNAVDKDEYPQTAAIEEYCWRMLADLWQAPNPAASLGTSTTGSSEACMLGGLALKRRWQNRRRACGLPIDQPNLVMSSGAQVCWEKFCNYWDVEPRAVPITADRKVLDGSALDSYVDQNTIGVVAIMGVTGTGLYEPVDQIAAALDAIQLETGHDVPIHVDAASGGMIAPFCQPELTWDFRLPRVASINTSGHKYGLVYPGLGWIVWRDRSLLPKDLVFPVSCLGGEAPTFALNFSRPGAQILLQYYMFLRLGRDGYARVQQSALDVAHYLASAVDQLGPFELWSQAADTPVFAWTLRDPDQRKWTLYDLSDRLRMRGWQVPAYPLPDDLGHVTVQRIVVRNGLSMDLADRWLKDLRDAVEHLESPEGEAPGRTSQPCFHH
ncbi:MAG: glutamate decarboxylase [Bifidobacteriaceae bacterium]|jgi:glutamate decarboxylase|nr:glutamate decarboxylase [Bifidobacteriaceae bacterium]